MGNESSKGGRGGLLKSSGTPSSSTVLKHLEQARKSRVLQLRSCQLKTVPDAIAEVSTLLRSLDLSVNRISTLPVSIGDFLNLKQLHLDDNKLKALPDEIGHLRKLETLSVAGNALEALPDTLIGCSALKHVDVSRNSLVVFPLPLCYLPELDTLNMTANAITAIPDEIGDLKASELNLNENRLHVLNDRLAQCPRLRILRVEENCLTKEQFSPVLLANSQLTLIAYAGNLFQDKDFQLLPGFEAYQERYTATKRKIF